MKILLALLCFISFNHFASAQAIDPQNDFMKALVSTSDDSIASGFSQVTIDPTNGKPSYSKTGNPKLGDLDTFSEPRNYQYGKVAAGVIKVNDTTKRPERITAALNYNGKVNYTTVSFNNSTLNTFTSCTVNKDGKSRCTAITPQVCKIISEKMNLTKLNAAFEACNEFDKIFQVYKDQITPITGPQITQDTTTINGTELIYKNGGKSTLSAWISDNDRTFSKPPAVAPTVVSKEFNLSMFGDISRMSYACNELITLKYIQGTKIIIPNEMKKEPATKANGS